ncbi:DUF11 domain-containing protein, partial [Candidatus Woesearchaeota archaeon]
MRRFTLVLVLALVLAVSAQEAPLNQELNGSLSVTVIEEIVEPAQIPYADDAVRVLSEELANAPEEGDGGSSEEFGSENVSVQGEELPQEMVDSWGQTGSAGVGAEQNNAGPAGAEESGEPKDDEGSVGQQSSTGGNESNSSEQIVLPAAVLEVVPEENISELVVESSNVTVVEEVIEPPKAPYVEDALERLADGLGGDLVEEFAGEVDEEGVPLESQGLAQNQSVDEVVAVVNESAPLLPEVNETGGLQIEDDASAAQNDSQNSSLRGEVEVNMTQANSTEVVVVNRSQANLTRVSVDLAVRDAKGKVLAADIRVLDPDTGELVAERARGVSSLLEVPQKKLTVEIALAEGPVEAVEIFDAELNGSFIRVDDTPESEVADRSFVQLYALDPAGMNFTGADVTVTAKGTALYKCASWDFDARSCPNGWVLFKSRLVPGEKYTFTMNATDPAFGEVNATDAVHIDETGIILENVFVQVSAVDGVFTGPIPQGHAIRATFSQNLTNGSVIDFIGRDNGTVAYVEIFVAGTNISVGRSGVLTQSWPEYVELANVPFETDTFDLRVVKQYHDVSAEVCDEGNPDCAEGSVADNARSAFIEFDFVHDELLTPFGANGLIGYAESGIAAPRYRIWNRTTGTFTAELTNAQAMSSNALWLRVRANHQRDEFIMLGLDSNTNTSVQVWNGSAWGNFRALSADNPNTANRGIDVAYEDVSGDALMVFETSAAADALIGFATWNGSAYAQGTYARPLTGAVNWVRTVARPGTDEVMVLMHDANNDIDAVLWNGSAFVAATNVTLTTTAAVLTEQMVDFAWMSGSGDGLAVYSSGGATYSYQVFNSTTKAWSGQQTFFTLDSGTAEGVRLCADPTSNYVGFVSEDTKDDANVRIWNGNAVETTPAPPTEDGAREANSPGGMNSDCAWMPNGTMMYGYVRSAAASDEEIAYCMYDKTAWSSATLAGCPISGNLASGGDSIEALDLYGNPVLNEVQALFFDINEDLGTALWTGTAWSLFGDVDANVACLNGATQCGFFDWDRYDLPPNASIVSPANGTNVSKQGSVNFTVDVNDTLAIGRVNVSVVHPDGSVQNLPLSVVSGNSTVARYSVIFNTTWMNGQYNFTVRASDNSTHGHFVFFSGFFNVVNGSNTVRLRQVIKGNGTALNTTPTFVVNFTNGTGGVELVNLSKAILIVSFNLSNVPPAAAATNAVFHGYRLTSPTEFTIYATNQNSRISAQFEYVIYEFTNDSLIDVQRDAEITNAGETFPKAISYTPIQLFGRASMLNDGKAYNVTEITIGTEELDRIRLLNETHWEFNVGSPPNSGPQDNYVSIIDWRDGDFVRRIQRGIFTLGAAEVGFNLTPSVSVNPNRTLLFVSHNVGADGTFDEPPSQVSLFATLNSSGVVVFRRGEGGPSLDVSWALVEFQPGTVLVQHVVVNVSDVQSVAVAPIRTVAFNQSSAFGTSSSGLFGYSGGSSTHQGPSNFTAAMFSIRLNTSSQVLARRGGTNGTAQVGVQILEFPLYTNVSLNKTDSPDPVVRGTQLNYTINISNSDFGDVLGLIVEETYPPGVSFVSSSPAPTSGNNTWLLGTMQGINSTTINITLGVGSGLVNGTVLNNTVVINYSNASGVQQANVTVNTTVRGFPVLFAAKADSPDPVPKGTALRYVINVTNQGDEVAYNVTVVDLYPENVTFNGSQPVPSSGNDTFVIPALRNGSSFLINITVNVSAAIVNGTVLNNSFTATYANVSGVNLSVSNSTLTTVLGNPVIVSIKSDAPDPVVKGSQLNYTILVNNTGDDTAFNVTITEVYPFNVSFQGSSPAPSAGNDTFSLGNLLPGQAVEINVTVNVSRFAPNSTVLNNSVNATFRNGTGQQNSVGAFALTTVLGFPEVVANKLDSPDPVPRGTQLVYQVVVNNTGDEVAYNVSVVDFYPVNVSFDSSEPVPSLGNNTFGVGNIGPGSSFIVNITVNVSAAIANGTVLNNSFNVTFANVSGVNLTFSNSTLTTVLGNPVIVSIKNDNPDPVVKGQQLNYTIAVNNTGDDTAFNVIVSETYPPGVGFHASEPVPTLGNGTFDLGTIAPGGVFLINVTVNVSSALSNGSVLNNSVSTTYRNSSNELNGVSTSELTTVIGFPVVFTDKADSPDPVPKGTTLTYVISVNNTGDEVAYNVTVFELYPANVAFNGSTIAPLDANSTFALGNIGPGGFTSLNITVNVSAAIANGTILNNSYNVTFANVSGVNLTVSNSTLTTVLGAPVILNIKSDSPDPVVKGQQLNYTIFINNTGDDTAFNVTVVEGYP